MFIRIMLFEIRNWLKRASTWVYFGLLSSLSFLTMLSVSGYFKSVHVGLAGTGGTVLINSPYVLAQIISILGYMGVIITAAVMASVGCRDFAHNSHPLIFACPITKWQYLGGRFIGAFIVLTLIFSGLGLGAWLGTHFPGIDAAKLAENQFESYLRPYLFMILPNLIFTSALFFGLAVLTRKTLSSYVAGIFLLLGYMIAGALNQDIENQTIAGVLDPFGLTAFGLLTCYWTVSDINFRPIPLTGIFLANRAVWISIGLLCLAAIFWLFRFSYANRFQRGAARSHAAVLANEPSPMISKMPLPFAFDFSFGAALKLTMNTAWIEFRGILSSLSFLLLSLAGVLFVFVNSTEMSSMYGTTTYPVTYQVLEMTGGSFFLFILIILTVFAGELVWKERERRFDQLMDTLPTPIWMAYLGKLGALVLMLVTLLSVVMACGLTIQAAQGYFRFEIGQYLTTLFGFHLFDYLLLCVLALLIQTLAPNKYIGYVLMVAYYVGYMFMAKFGLEHNLFRYASDPGLLYSDMNGYPRFMMVGAVAFKAYWGAFACLLGILTHLFWQRGTDSAWRLRWRVARQRFTRPLQWASMAFTALFIGIGAFIYYNTNILNVYLTTFEGEEIVANYEKQYKQYETLPQPKITDVRLEADIYASERKLRVKGTYQLQNKTETPIATVHLRVPAEMDIRQLAFEQPAQVVVEDRVTGYSIHRLAAPLQPGAACSLSFELAYEPKGFRNSIMAYENSPWLFPNGTFINNEFLPRIGYRADIELAQDDVRKKHDLPKKETVLPDVNDPEARQKTFIADSDWMTYAAAISTDADQIAVTPGDLENTWTEGNRRYFQYSMGATKIENFIAVLSGRYAVKKAEWRGLPIEIYYHPGHEYNLERMITGVQKSLDYYTAQFGAYPFRQVRIVEFPRYSEFAQAFQGMIPYSEGVGFIARVRPDDEKDVDYPFYVTAHEMAHQWWGHQVEAANVQGGGLIIETLSQYSAMMVMEQEFGQAQMKRFLKYELDRYLSGRSFERKYEPPLARVEDQGYVYYNKGSVAMYALRDYIGEERVNAALRKYLQAVAFQEPPYTNSLELLTYLREETPPEYHYLLADLFESITLFENKAVTAKATPLPDGQYQVQLKVASKKLRADQTGAESEVPLNDAIDIGVFDEKGQTLYAEKRRITQPETEFTLLVKGKPAKAGIDLYNKLIDRDSNDNVIRVELEG